MHPLKGPGQGLGPGDVVDAVQTADAGVDGAVEIQLLHGLVEEDGLVSPAPRHFSAATASISSDRSAPIIS